MWSSYKRLGTFLAPLHATREHPTVALERDLRPVEHLDQLGFDEIWIGEYHSGGMEIIASPELFIAAAAERTRRVMSVTTHWCPVYFGIHATSPCELCIWAFLGSWDTNSLHPNSSWPGPSCASRPQPGIHVHPTGGCMPSIRRTEHGTPG